jgi:hypothetical protein
LIVPLFFLAEKSFSAGIRKGTFQSNKKEEKGMSDEDQGNCPNCRKPLVGAVEVLTTTTDGIPTIVLQETSDRNWIQCDSCSLIICKGCCKDAGSGFCNDCLEQQQTAVLSESATTVFNRSTG